VVEEVAETCRRYGVSLVTTDHYGGNLVASLFAEAGLQHRVSELPASDLYLRFVTTVQTRRIELPDPALSGTAQRLLRELRSVERRPGPGKDQATAPRGEGHADLGNAVAGLAFLLSQRASAPAVLIDSEALLIPRATPSPSFGYDPNALELPESDMTAEESWDASVALGRRARRFGW
jgi:hypothetical protein